MFAPRTEDMNTGFLMPSSSTPSSTSETAATTTTNQLTSIDDNIIFAEIDPSDPAHDLTHLAPEAGDSFSCYPPYESTLISQSGVPSSTSTSCSGFTSYSSTFSELQPELQSLEKNSSSPSGCSSSSSGVSCDGDCFVHPSSLLSSREAGVTLIPDDSSSPSSSSSCISRLPCSASLQSSNCSLSSSSPLSSLESFAAAPSSVSSSFLVTAAAAATSSTTRTERESLSTSTSSSFSSLVGGQERNLHTKNTFSNTDSFSTSCSDDNSLLLSSSKTITSTPASIYSCSSFLQQEEGINQQQHQTDSHLEVFGKRKFEEATQDHYLHNDKEEEERIKGNKKLCLPLDLDSLPVFEGIDMDDLLRDILTADAKKVEQEDLSNKKRSLEDDKVNDCLHETSNVIFSANDDCANTSFMQSSCSSSCLKQMSIDPSVKVFHSMSDGKSSDASSLSYPVKRRKEAFTSSDVKAQVCKANGDDLTSQMISEEEVLPLDDNLGNTSEGSEVDNMIESPEEVHQEESLGSLVTDSDRDTSDSGMESTGNIESAFFDSSSNSSSDMNDIYNLMHEEPEGGCHERPVFSPSTIIEDEASDVMMSSSCQTYLHPNAVGSSVWDSPASSSDNFSCFNTDSLENIYSNPVNIVANNGMNRESSCTTTTTTGSIVNIKHELEDSDDFPLLNDDSLWDSFIDSNLPDITSNMMMMGDVFSDNSSSFVSPLMTSSTLSTPGMNSISGKNSTSDHLLPSSMICKPSPTLPLTSSLAMLLQQKTPVAQASTRKLLTTTSGMINLTNKSTVDSAVKHTVKGSNSNPTTHNIVVQNGSRQTTHALRLGPGITLTFAPNNGQQGVKQHLVLTTSSSSSSGSNNTSLIPLARKIVRLNGIRHNVTAASGTAFIKNGSLTVSPGITTTTSTTTSSSSSAQSQGNSSNNIMTSNTCTSPAKPSKTNHIIMNDTSHSSYSSPSSLSGPTPVKGNSVLMNLLVNGEDVSNGYSKCLVNKNQSNHNNHRRSRTSVGSNASNRFHQRNLNFSGSSLYSSSSSSSSSPGSSSPLSFSPLLSSAAMMSEEESNFFEMLSANTSLDPFSSDIR